MKTESGNAEKNFHCVAPTPRERKQIAARLGVESELPDPFVKAHVEITEMKINGFDGVKNLESN
jgi:hypothetical protein